MQEKVLQKKHILHVIFIGQKKWPRDTSFLFYTCTQMHTDTHRLLKCSHLVVVSLVKRERAQQTKGQWTSHVHQGCFLHETDGFVKYSFSRVWPLYIPAFHACCQSMSSLSQLSLCDLSKSKSVGKKKRTKGEKRGFLQLFTHNKGGIYGVYSW